MATIGTIEARTQTLAGGALVFAGLSAGLALMDRRSRAVAEHWRTLGAVREASELPAAGYGYLTRLIEDYTAAFAACWAPLAPGGPPPGEEAPVAGTAPLEVVRAA